MSGKGSEPLAVYRIGELKQVATFAPNDFYGFWDRSSDVLYIGGGGVAKKWSPDSGTVDLPGAAYWSYLGGLSPDGNQVAYTAYLDPNNQVDPRVYVYQLRTSTTRILVDDKPRSQVVFVKDGWVWYLEEMPCASGCPGSTQPSGKVFAMNLSTGVEQEVVFAGGDGTTDLVPGEFWPNA